MFVVEKVGYIAPFALFGSMLVAIGSGLITTFLPHTGVGQWVGYQLLAGIGRASVMQMVRLSIPQLHSSLLSLYQEVPMLIPHSQANDSSAILPPSK
jgi:hypothetical protein